MIDWNAVFAAMVIEVRAMYVRRPVSYERVYLFVIDRVRDFGDPEDM